MIISQSSLWNASLWGAKIVKFSFWFLSSGMKLAFAIAMARVVRFLCEWMMSTISLSEILQKNHLAWIEINFTPKNIKYILHYFDMSLSSYLFHPFYNAHMKVCSLHQCKNMDIVLSLHSKCYTSHCLKGPPANMNYRFLTTVTEFLSRYPHKLKMNKWYQKFYSNTSNLFVLLVVGNNKYYTKKSILTTFWMSYS